MYTAVYERQMIVIVAVIHVCIIVTSIPSIIALSVLHGLSNKKKKKTIAKRQRRKEIEKTKWQQLRYSKATMLCPFYIHPFPHDFVLTSCSLIEIASVNITLAAILR